MQNLKKQIPSNFVNQNYLNLEETPFKDLRKHKQTNSFITDFQLTQDLNYNLPINQDNLQWEVLKGRSKFDQSKIDIPDKIQKEMVNNIIKQYKKIVSEGFKIKDNNQLIEMVKLNQKIINQRSQQGYIKPILVGYISSNCSLLQNLFPKNLYLQRLMINVQKKKYPLAIIHLALANLTSKSIKLNDIQNMFKIGIQFGESFVYIHYGQFCRQQSRFKQAYQLYKNSEKNGYICSYPALGQLFLSADNITFQRNISSAKKYFDLSKKMNIGNLQEYKNALKQLTKQLQRNQIRANSIISTPETQSKYLANFITNKFNQIQFQKQNLFTFGNTNNFSSSDEYGICFKQKIFHVVFSPMMIFPSRGFIAKDEKGIIECIVIYNWHKINPQKLSLLHKLGIKIVLHQYIRKYGANDHLPMYRIQNPYSIQILPNAERHCISDEQYRNFAKILFNQQYYQKAMVIYDHLICKKAKNLQIVYSNKGLIYQNQNNITQAVKNYKKSLQISKYLKSQVRLANIYINQQKFQQAKLISNQVEDQMQKKILIKKILDATLIKNKKQQQQIGINIQQLNLKTIQFLKKQVRIQKKIQKITNEFFEVNPSASMSIIIGDIKKYCLYFKYELSQLLQINLNLNQEKYLKELQNVFDAAQLPINQQNLPKISKFFNFAYRQFQYNFKEEYFEQAAGYMCLYTKIHILSFPLNTSMDLGVQLAGNLGMRCNYLQNRLQDYCINLQRNGNYQYMQKIYESANDHCIIFCRKISQILFKRSKHQQNILYCEKILKKIQKIKEKKKVFQSKVLLTNSKIKSMIKLKKFNQSLIQGEEFITKISKENPKNICQKIFISKQVGLFLFNMEQDKYKNEIVCDEIVWSLKNNISLCFYHSLRLNQALKYIDEGMIKKYQKKHKELTFSTVIFSYKIQKELWTKIIIIKFCEINFDYKLNLISFILCIKFINFMREIYCLIRYVVHKKIILKTDTNIQRLLKLNLKHFLQKINSFFTQKQKRIYKKNSLKNLNIESQYKWYYLFLKLKFY